MQQTVRTPTVLVAVIAVKCIQLVWPRNSSWLHPQSPPFPSPRDRWLPGRVPPAVNTITTRVVVEPPKVELREEVATMVNNTQHREQHLVQEGDMYNSMRSSSSSMVIRTTIIVT
uniref:Putative secreted peptide n=1 Tax=Anopheles braziliensis TaxID=58242 RepID=A0A2M3ZPG8_9DIPT